MSTDNPSGWTTVHDLLDPDQIIRIRSELDELLELPASERAVGDKPSAGTRHLEELDRRSPSIAMLIEQPRLVDVVAAFLPDPGNPVQVSYRSPQPGHGGQQLHSDGVPRSAPAPTEVVTAIVALCDFTERNGATRLIPGSHLRPDLQRMAGKLGEHADARTLTGAAGTAFVFDGHVLHSGTNNASEHERPALQILWRRVGTMYA